MAFATSNLSRENYGSVNVLRGNWTGTVGDAAGTVTVAGGAVFSAHFEDNLTSGPDQGLVPVSVSTSSGQSTVSVYNHATVTSGTFEIRFK